MSFFRRFDERAELFGVFFAGLLEGGVEEDEGAVERWGLLVGGDGWWLVLVSVGREVRVGGCGLEEGGTVSCFN